MRSDSREIGKYGNEGKGERRDQRDHKMYFYTQEPVSGHTIEAKCPDGEL